MGRTGINVRIPNREYAWMTVKGFSTNPTYLRNLIYECVPGISESGVDSMTPSQVLNYGRVIRGVAEKIVRTSRKEAEGQDLEGTVSDGEQLTFL